MNNAMKEENLHTFINNEPASRQVNIASLKKNRFDVVEIYQILREEDGGALWVDNSVEIYKKGNAKLNKLENGIYEAFMYNWTDSYKTDLELMSQGNISFVVVNGNVYFDMYSLSFSTKQAEDYFLNKFACEPTEPAKIEPAKNEAQSIERKIEALKKIKEGTVKMIEEAGLELKSEYTKHFEIEIKALNKQLHKAEAKATNTPPARKELSEASIRTYSNKQILKHLDRFMSKHFNVDPFRIDYQTGEVRLYDAGDKAYYYFCSTEDRDTILKALFTTYKLARQGK